MTCPQGVTVAFVGGEKHIGQLYSDNKSGRFAIAEGEDLGCGDGPAIVG